MKRLILAASLLATSLCALSAPLALGSWSTQNFATMSGHPNGQWSLQGDGSIKHSTNGQPSLYLAPGSTGAVRISGQVRSTDADDDFFGFAFGVGGGDWLLIDWKKATQTHDFTGSTATATPGATGRVGLAASLVQGTPTADEFWGHTNFAQDAGGGLTELARGATLGNSGWARNTWYQFDFLLMADSLSVVVNGTEQFRIDGGFADGQFGFYNFSQPSTEYRGFTANAVPEPASLLLGASGLALAGVLGRRRRKA